MSFSVSTHPHENKATIQAILQANLLSVFNERDEAARWLSIQNIYKDDVIWYEGDSDVLTGHESLHRRAGELLAESPAFEFKPEGEMVASQNVGVLGWTFGPPGRPDVVKGTDVIIVEDGKVKALWTAVSKITELGSE